MVFEKVKQVIAEGLNCEENIITLEANLQDDLGADSLDAVEIVMALEDAFGVTIEEEAADKMVTVGDLVAYLEAHAQT